MIKSWCHKGLQLFYETGSTAKISAAHANKLHDILQALDAATHPDHMQFPAFKLHALKGAAEGFYAVSVNANWRVVFAFVGKDAVKVDYLDYH